jgi:hypothetical protein
MVDNEVDVCCEWQQGGVWGLAVEVNAKVAGCGVRGRGGVTRK